MRRLIVLAVVVALALLIVPAAFAGNGPGGSGGSGGCGGSNGSGPQAAVVNYSLSGNVTAVDADNGIVSVTVVRANKAARGYKGETVDLRVASTTLYYERTADGERVAVMLTDISVGDRITSSGKLTKATDTFQAKCITIALPLGTCLNTS